MRTRAQAHRISISLFLFLSMSFSISSDSVSEVRLWKIKDDSLHEIAKPRLDLEERLENWIASDISIIGRNARAQTVWRKIP